VVLVEGGSDRNALLALASRRGHDLDAEGVQVVVTGGATNMARFVARSAAPGVRVAGLVDAPEERYARGALTRAGLAVPPGREGLAAQGFFVCDPDLEHELVRALGMPAVEEVLRSRGDLARFRTMQNQPAQRGRDPVAQLCRFLGAGSGRKHVYATALVDALDLGAVPVPLAAVLDHVLRPSRRG
jgi:hypothetical protein